MRCQGCQISGDFDRGGLRFQAQIELATAIGELAQQTADRELGLAGPGGDRIKNQFVRRRRNAAARSLSGAAAESTNSLRKSRVEKVGEVLGVGAAPAAVVGFKPRAQASGIADFGFEQTPTAVCRQAPA